MIYLPTPQRVQSQPQQGARFDEAALRRLGIVGGLFAGGGQAEPWNLNGSPFTRSAGGNTVVGWRIRPGLYGNAAEYFDDGGSRTLSYTSSPVHSQNFSVLTRVRADAVGGSGVLLRSDLVGTGGTIPLWRNGGFDMRVNTTDYTAAGTWDLGQWYDIEIVGSASDCQLFVDGALVINGGAAAAGNIDANFAVGSGIGGGGASSGNFLVSYILWCDRALSRTERADFRRNPWQLFEQPQRIWVPVAAGAATAPVGRGDETDTSLALARLQLATTGRADEVDSSLALAAVQMRATGLAAETDTALALAAVQLATTGLSDEADAALTLAAVQIAATGRADEADAALELAFNTPGVTGRADEADAAVALAAVQLAAVGRADELDEAVALAAAQATATSPAIEVDAAFALAARQSAGLGLAEEIDSSLALVAATGFAAGLALEINAAFALTPMQARATGIAEEIDLAIDLEDGVPDEQYPLAGLIQGLPLAGLSQTYPLAGQTQTYPLS